jgi:GDPmannose 4,6-dehydratase
MRKALITGIGGQDGSILAELLLQDGYEVYGFIKREAMENASHKLKNLAAIQNRIELIPISVTDPIAVFKAIAKIRPDEVYHLAASSFVSYEFEDEITIMNSNFNSTYNLLSSVYDTNPGCKFFFAGSSEMFGEPLESPQNEESKFNPKSIYGISKVSSFYLLKNYRDKKNMFTCTGIMYNHESSRRKSEFVTKKIIETAVNIKLGKASELQLGNVEAVRDWGYAPDYMRAARMIMAQEKPDDYIIATGKLHSVRQFAEMAFQAVGLTLDSYLKINTKYYRASELQPLCGDAKKLMGLGWHPTKSLQEVIDMMVHEELANQQPTKP